MGFTQAGLPLGVTFSFLISSPMVDLGSLVLLMSIFGWKIALLYVALGLMIAVAGGTVIERLHLESEVADFIRNGKSVGIVEETPSQRERFKGAFRSVLDTLKKVFPYILAGVAVGAFIHNWIPQGWIEAVLGKNNPLGVALSFLMAVTTLSLPSLVMLKKVVKTRLLFAFVAICVVGIVLVGYFFNAVQTALM